LRRFSSSICAIFDNSEQLARYSKLFEEDAMADNLWDLRQRRNLTVKQLAGKSGVSAASIYAYEGGEMIKLSDLNKLAKALYVNSADIKNPPDPRPKSKPEKPAPLPPKPAAERPSPPPTSPTTPPAKSVLEARPRPLNRWQKMKLKQLSQPVTEGQINHLLMLAAKMEQDETAVVERIGKPFAELTFGEAKHWITTYTNELKVRKAAVEGERPPGTRRPRAHLPEGVDEFEANYLLARQEAGDELTFTLLNDNTFNGRIIGFSPYNITISQADGTEMTLQKMALAYYSVVPTTPTDPAFLPLEKSDEPE
jgi:transcriptional regulator with XRE-family HTH domain